MPNFLAVGAVVLTIASCLFVGNAHGEDTDLRMWMPVQIVHSNGEKWTFSFQTETRLKERISEFEKQVYKPAINIHFNETWWLSLGHKWIDRNSQILGDEHEPWQELHYNKTIDDLSSGFQLRLEERFIQNIDGVLPRLRLLQHLSHPIGESPNYVTGFGAIRFNLDEKGEGPVSGFEQSRIFVGLGRHIGERVQLEGGYLWQYERERTVENRSNHVIRFFLVFNTQAKRIQKPRQRDFYR